MKRCWPGFLLFGAACSQQADAPVAAHRASDDWKASYSPTECKALTENAAYLLRCHPEVDPTDPNFAEKLDEENFVGRFNCMPYSPPQRFEGVWVIGMESSRFYPNVSTYEATTNLPDQTWLEFDVSVPPEATEAGQGAGTHAYSIDVIGRRSLCEWHYGHLGMSPHEVVAQRIVSLQPLLVTQRERPLSTQSGH